MFLGLRYPTTIAATLTRILLHGLLHHHGEEVGCGHGLLLHFLGVLVVGGYLRFGLVGEVGVHWLLLLLMGHEKF